MTLDMVLNLFLLTYFASAIEILAAGNLGYMLSHVFALTGFLLLRRDRPEWPRPIRLSAIWLPDRRRARGREPAVHRRRRVHLRGQYGYGWDKTLVGIIVLLVRSAVRVPAHRAGQDGHPAARGHADATGGGMRPRSRRRRPPSRPREHPRGRPPR